MKIAFVRTASNILKYGGYNIQEIGLAKALMPFGVSTDVYARFSNITETCEVENDGHGNSVVVHPLKGKQIYREIMYYPELKKDLLNGGYDMVQLLDDSQMMLPMLFKALKKAGVKTILWQGMYRDFGGKAAHAMQIVYDCLCAKTLDKYSDLKIAKTDVARDYLIKKKYNNIVVLPVGLDKVIYERDESLEQRIDSFKKKHSKILLYIGAIEPRRNPDFLLDNHLELCSIQYYTFLQFHNRCCLEAIQKRFLCLLLFIITLTTIIILFVKVLFLHMKDKELLSQ